MKGKKMTRKGVKEILVKEDLHTKLMHIKIDKKLKNVSDVIEWLLQQTKV